MPWVRLDDQFPKHPKIAAVGPLAGWLQVCGLCYCNQYLTDGFIPRSVAFTLTHYEHIGLETGGVEGMFAVGDDVDCKWMVEILCKYGIWKEVEGGYLIHDYLDYQPSRAEVEEARAKKQAAGQAGGQASAQARAQAKSNPKPKPKPIPTPKPSAEAKASGATRLVYDCWREERKRTDPRYATVSEGRRKKIQARLKEFSVEELCEAIRAVARDPWPERANNDDLTVIFRSREQVERFLGFTTNGASLGKPFPCHCGQSFLRAERLAEHQSDVHGVAA